MLSTAAAIGKSAGNALMAFFSANIFISIFFAQALQFLWSMINAMQIIVLTILFKIEVPPNADMLMTLILKLCSLDLVPTEDILAYVITFRATDAFATTIDEDGEAVSKFADAGYESAIYI